MSEAAVERGPFATAFESRGTVHEPPWLRGLRAAAYARFENLGFPSSRDEEWRQTNVAAIARTAFVPNGRREVESLEIDALALAPATGPRLVLVDGRLSAALSHLDRLPKGVTLASLARTVATAPQLVEPFLAKIAAFDDRAFVALNTALFEDGAYVAIAKGVAVETPIEILHVATAGQNPAALHARTLIVAGEGAQAHVVETFLGLSENAYFRNAVCEIVLAADAKVDHHRVQAESAAAWHVGALQADQARDSRLVSHNVSFGALLARHDLGSRLDGEGADCQMYGLAFADGARMVDNHTVLDHAKPNCPSREMYKTVLAGEAKAVFNGRIIVRPDAQKTDAKQSNKSLLLSREALVFTRPQLEIYANDVKCTHGATIGRLDEEATFYLRARGIGRDEARDLLIRAFALDVLDKIRPDGVRERVETELLRRLPRTIAG